MKPTNQCYYVYYVKWYEMSSELIRKQANKTNEFNLPLLYVRIFHNFPYSVLEYFSGISGVFWIRIMLLFCGCPLSLILPQFFGDIPRSLTDRRQLIRDLINLKSQFRVYSSPQMFVNRLLPKNTVEMATECLEKSRYVWKK